MQPMVLTIVFAENMLSVLMCENQKLGANNFIGGKIVDGETMMAASYRELYEETGITPEDVELRLVRHEVTTSPVLGEWEIYVTCGVLKHPVELREEKNKLFWAYTYEDSIFLNAYGNGNCANYLREAYLILTEKYDKVIDKEIRPIISKRNNIANALRDFGVPEIYYSPGLDFEADRPEGTILLPIEMDLVLYTAIYKELTEDGLLAEDQHLSLLSVLPNDRDFRPLRNLCTEVLRASSR